jgi:transposase InsO family protein
VGSGYVVSVRHGASISYAAVRKRCESCPAVLSHGEDYILYATECLNTHWFLSLADAQEKMEDWRRYYNEERPHGAWIALVRGVPPAAVMAERAA